MNAQRRIETYTRVRPSITPRQRRRVVHKARGKERAAALALLAALAVSACSSGSGSRFGEVARVAAGPPPTTAPTTTTQPPAPPSPPAVTRSAPGGRARVPSPRPRSAPSDPWGCIRQYESGGTTDPAGSNIPGGGYYQFKQGTWASVGGHGRPSDASYEEQTARAQALQRRSGWGQWSTARRCGLV